MSRAVLAGSWALGAMLTLLLPEPKGQSLESLTDDPILRSRVRTPARARAQPVV